MRRNVKERTSLMLFYGWLSFQLPQENRAKITTTGKIPEKIAKQGQKSFPGPEDIPVANPSTFLYFMQEAHRRIVLSE